MIRRAWFAAVMVLGLAVASIGAEPQPYRTFKVTVYIPVQLVERMGRDAAWLDSSWSDISSRLHVDEVFIETYRGGTSAANATIDHVKHFFASHGVVASGGMAMAGPSGSAQFRSLDYTDPQDRDLVKRMSALTARHFDTIMLDDFFFNNTKSDSDIAAKGKRSWDKFRLELMDEVSRDLVLKPAQDANPKVRVIIKYPNWYPSFQGLGYDLEREPQMFPEIWTGDETRDPEITDQQLQQYESYEVFRYLENVAPGRNGGGWVDPYAVRYLDRYAEQLWDTIFAKAPAINLFQYSDLVRPAEAGDRSGWQVLPTSFNFFEMMRECCGLPFSPQAKTPLLADVAAYALRQVDRVAGRIGRAGGLGDLPAVSIHWRGFSVRRGGHDRDSGGDVPGMAKGKDGAAHRGGEVRFRHRHENRAAPARRRQCGDHLRPARRPPGSGSEPNHRHAPHRSSACGHVLFRRLWRGGRGRNRG